MAVKPPFAFNQETDIPALRDELYGGNIFSMIMDLEWRLRHRPAVYQKTRNILEDLPYILRNLPGLTTRVSKVSDILRFEGEILPMLRKHEKLEVPDDIGNMIETTRRSIASSVKRVARPPKRKDADDGQKNTG